MTDHRMMWRRLLASVLGLVLLGCASPIATRTPEQVSKTTYAVDKFGPYESALAGVSLSTDAGIALGYDGQGRLIAWLSMFRRAPDYAQPRDLDVALSIVAQAFHAVPALQGVWVAHHDGDLTMTYFPRSVFDEKRIPLYSGTTQPYHSLDWAKLSQQAWTLTDRWESSYGEHVDQLAADHVKKLFGDRQVSVTMPKRGIDRTGLRVEVHGLPPGNAYTTMEEWARAAVAVTGRFYWSRFGVYLDEIVWVDQSNTALLTAGMSVNNYPLWWTQGMRPGQMLFWGGKLGGQSNVETWRPMEPNHTSGRGPWWETGRTLEPAFSYLTSKIKGAKVLFVGRQDGGLVAALSLDLPATASPQDAWKAQMDAALTAMAVPIHEVWVIVRQGNTVRAAFLDRMGYDAIQYPDKQMPPVTPDLWPYVATIYAEQVSK